MKRRHGRGRTLTGYAVNQFFVDALKEGAVLNTLKKFEYKQGVARKEELFKKLRKQGLTQREIDTHLGKLIRSGDVFTPREGYYRRTAYKPRKRRKR